MKLTNLVQELILKGFDVGMSIENGEPIYTMNGFYTSGRIKLYQDGDGLYADVRYGEVTELDDETPFNTLVRLNYTWWNNTKDTYKGWKTPDVKWIPYLTSMGFIREEIRTEKIYV